MQRGVVGMVVREKERKFVAMCCEDCGVERMGGYDKDWIRKNT